VATIPVGLCGELTISARVRGVMASRSASDVDGEAAAVGDQRHGHPVASGHAMTGEYES